MKHYMFWLIKGVWQKDWVNLKNQFYTSVCKMSSLVVPSCFVPPESLASVLYPKL